MAKETIASLTERIETLEAHIAILSDALAGELTEDEMVSLAVNLSKENRRVNLADTVSGPMLRFPDTGETFFPSRDGVAKVFAASRRPINQPVKGSPAA